MVSSFSPRFRLNYQAPGDNLNTWGLTLNSGVFQLLEDALAKRVTFTLSGAKTLAAANGLEDEARCVFLDVTGGAGGTVTAPPVEKLYVVRNASVGDVVVTTGAGEAATVKPGEVVWIVSDAANFRRVQATDMLGARLSGLGAPIVGSDAASKTYVDALAFQKVNLPGQGVGTAGQFVRSDGAVANWALVDVSDIAGLADALDGLAATDSANLLAAKNLAAAFAVVL